MGRLFCRLRQSGLPKPEEGELYGFYGANGSLLSVVRFVFCWQ
jgi:hypothetical protein